MEIFKPNFFEFHFSDVFKEKEAAQERIYINKEESKTFN